MCFDEENTLGSQGASPSGWEGLFTADFVLFPTSDCYCIENLAGDSGAHSHVTSDHVLQNTLPVQPAKQQNKFKVNTSADNDKEIAPNGSLAVVKKDIQLRHERARRHAKRAGVTPSSSSKDSGKLGRGGILKEKTTLPPRAPILSRLPTPELSDMECKEFCTSC